MKPPITPTRFRTPVKHYHRHAENRSRTWDSWVGGERSSGSLVLKAFLALLGLASVVGTWLLVR